MRREIATPHLVFRVHNRRGLGHLVRATLLALELQKLAPGCGITFVVRNQPAKQYELRGVRYLVAPDPDHLGRSPRELFLPAVDLLIDDTVVPPLEGDEIAESGVPRALVMRRSTPQRHAELLAHPALHSMRAIVVPHEESDFGHQFPVELAERVTYAGAVARQPDPTIGAQRLARYGIADSDALLISTPGGGGFEADLERFIAIVEEVHTQILNSHPRLKHLLVLGPNAAHRPVGLPRLMVIDEEPHLASLFPHARAVISAAGYNTINELRVAQAPAMLLPGNRRYDDQVERCTRLGALGLAAVFDANQPARAVEGIVATLCDDAALATMREAHRVHPLALGNERATHALLAALRA